jgi:3-phosphoshikimate 1-carboxyvinyltransferase
MRIRPARSFRGTFSLPGDKSITHRAFLFGAIAKGRTTIEGASFGEDCASTRRCLESLGVRFELSEDRRRFSVQGGESLVAPAGLLDCGNSGTTLRLLMGLLAGSNFEATLAGDESLNRRPMERVAKPLREMGARIETRDGRPPVTVTGSKLHGAALTPEAASAQIKSAILLAALGAPGRTAIHEPEPTRDHTERMIRSFGGVLKTEGRTIEIDGPQTLTARHVNIPGDPSSAAPFVVAGLILPDSEVVIEGVLLNPHRVRYLEVLRQMGGRIDVEVTSAADSEPSGRIIVRSSELTGIEIDPKDVPAIVDELPILAIAGAFAKGHTLVRGAGELRVKESDRIKAMVAGLQAMGGRIAEMEDGFSIQGGAPLSGASVSSQGDHRIAMALSVAALDARGDTDVEGAEAVAISLPTFFDELDRGAGR